MTTLSARGKFKSDFHFNRVFYRISFTGGSNHGERRTRVVDIESIGHAVQVFSKNPPSTTFFFPDTFFFYISKSASGLLSDRRRDTGGWRRRGSRHRLLLLLDKGGLFNPAQDNAYNTQNKGLG